MLSLKIKKSINSKGNLTSESKQRQSYFPVYKNSKKPRVGRNIISEQSASTKPPGDHRLSKLSAHQRYRKNTIKEQDISQDFSGKKTVNKGHNTRRKLRLNYEKNGRQLNKFSYFNNRNGSK